MASARTVPFFTSAKDAAESPPLAQELFRIDGVTAVFLGADFITVTKNDASGWENAKPLLADLPSWIISWPESRYLLAAKLKQLHPAADESELVTQIREPRSTPACARPWPRTAAILFSKASMTGSCN